MDSGFGPLGRPKNDQFGHHPFGIFSSILLLSMMTCLMKTRGSTLSPFRKSGENVDAHAAPQHRIKLDGHAEIAVLELGGSAGGTPFMPVTMGLALAIGGKHGLRGAERHVVIGSIDRCRDRGWATSASSAFFDPARGWSRPSV